MPVPGSGPVSARGHLPAGTARDEPPAARGPGTAGGLLRGTSARFDLPLAPRGTPFQLRVWRALQDIPYGQTCSYSELAAAISSPRACRAVGQANGRNPLMIVIPCHRVIAAGGGLGGYSGGLDIKRFLLRLEAGLPMPEDR